MSVNRFQFTGNLTRDTELRYTGDDKASGFFDIAVTTTWRDGSGKESSETNYPRIKFFGRAAENHAKYLGKGSTVYVEGRVKTTSWEKDGVRHYGTDFVADHVEYFNTKPPAGSPSN